MTRVYYSCLLACLAGVAAAQNVQLADPTRPPSAVAESAASEPAARPGPTLQSILISPTRRVAVINGQTVVQGGKFRDATVANITEGSVLLQYADRRQTLQLISGVGKRERRVADAVSSDKGTFR